MPKKGLTYLHKYVKIGTIFLTWKKLRKKINFIHSLRRLKKMKKERAELSIKKEFDEVASEYVKKSEILITLKEAEEILSDPEQSRDQQNDSGNRGNNKNEQDNKQDNEPNHNIPPESSNESGQTPESTPDSTENWNKQQAENLLNAMEQDAKDLKEMLKQIQKMQNSRQKQPEKDW